MSLEFIAILKRTLHKCMTILTTDDIFFPLCTPVYRIKKRSYLKDEKIWRKKRYSKNVHQGYLYSSKVVFPLYSNHF